ncbi:MAG: adenosylmethionine--8-amino-7-oxononanoate transaminase [Acidimicrobiales bacterium]|nr:adenosylmethionine--8-amino-7-oxononanoate transaminase [Acidimicrobiales bacterium]
MFSKDWIDRDSKRVWHGFTQMSTYGDLDPVIVERGEGHYLFDVDGNKYLDAISSLWVTTLGHKVPALDKAIVDQLGRIAHSTLLGNGSKVVIELSEALAKVVPIEDPHFLYASDGASALEQALKIAFQYWKNLGIGNRETFLALGDSYHGDTMGSVSLGDGGFGTNLFDPLRFQVLRTPGYLASNWLEMALETVVEVKDRLAAVVFEPICQGAAGMYVALPQDVKTFVDKCQELEILVIADEVATGFGRTGEIFASTLAGITPDIMCIGKGLSGGYLPISATVASGRVFEAFLGPDLSQKTFYHGHSFSGNALSCAVSLAHLDLFSKLEIVSKVQKTSSYLAEILNGKIADHPLVKEIRQIGLMVGVEVEHDGYSNGQLGRIICKYAVSNGALLRPLGDVIVLMPHLTFGKTEIDEMINILLASLNSVDYVL